MKKNLAKRIVLGLLTSAVLMSSSVAWANGNDRVGLGPNNIGNDFVSYGSQAVASGIAIGQASCANGTNSIAIGFNDSDGSNGYITHIIATGHDSIAIGRDAEANDAIAIGAGSKALFYRSMALGAAAEVAENTTYSVALGYGSKVSASNAVSVGSGVEGDSPATRHIINVTDLEVNDLKNNTYGSYAVNVNTLNAALSGYYTKTEVEGLLQSGGVGGNVVKTQDKGSGAKETAIGNLSVQESASGSVTLSAGTGVNTSAVVTFEQDKVVFGENSSWYEEEKGFFAGSNDGTHDIASARAALKEDGSLMGASGKFIVDGSTGNVTASSYIIKDSNGNETNIKTALDSKANAADVYTRAQADSKFADKAGTTAELAKKVDKDSVYTKTEADGLIDTKANKNDVYTKAEVDNKIDGGSAAVAGLNQRLEKTNAKINKVGAGAAALGAFYRPNEKFMLSLGGTMGNGENMVNLGLSIGLDKASGLAKLSKKELIQKVNAVEAENDALEDRVAKLEALVAQLAKK